MHAPSTSSISDATLIEDVSLGQAAQIAGFAWLPLDISKFPTRHDYRLALWQNHIERFLAGWVGELTVPLYRGREVTGFAQDGTAIAFPGWDPTTSNLFAEVELAEEPEWGP